MHEAAAGIGGTESGGGFMNRNLFLEGNGPKASYLPDFFL
jgi:hypothetical protein